MPCPCIWSLLPSQARHPEIRGGPGAQGPGWGSAALVAPGAGVGAEWPGPSGSGHADAARATKRGLHLIWERLPAQASGLAPIELVS